MRRLRLRSREHQASIQFLAFPPSSCDGPSLRRDPEETDRIGKGLVFTWSKGSSFNVCLSTKAVSQSKGRARRQQAGRKCPEQAGSPNCPPVLSVGSSALPRVQPGVLSGEGPGRLSSLLSGGVGPEPRAREAQRPGWQQSESHPPCLQGQEDVPPLPVPTW